MQKSNGIPKVHHLSLTVQARRDKYSDHPGKLGGGSAYVACGLVLIIPSRHRRYRPYPSQTPASAINALGSSSSRIAHGLVMLC